MFVNVFNDFGLNQTNLGLKAFISNDPYHPVGILSLNQTNLGLKVENHKIIDEQEIDA